MAVSQLILNKKGASLSVRNGRFQIRTEERETLVPVHQVRSICLHPATKVTYEAMVTALEHDVDLLLIDHKGFPVGRLWGGRFGSISTIRKNQLAFAAAPAAVEWVRQLLLRKAENQLSVLQLLHQLSGQLPTTSASPPDEMLLSTTQKTLQRLMEKCRYHKAADLADTFGSFRGFEGSMSRAYFAALSALLPERYQFKRRSQHPALDGFNCLLNYAYGMLYGYCESALIRAGLDPAIGIMHRDEYNRPVLVYDFIEPYRCWADYVVCHLCMQEVVYEEFFEVNPTGQYWLNATGKRILIQSFNDYLQEIIYLQGLNRSRLTHIELDAQRLATQMKRFEPSVS